MSRHRGYAWDFVVFSFMIVFLAGQVLASGDSREARLEEVRKYIGENSYSWVADHTSVSDMSPEEFHGLLGLRVPEDYEDILREVRSKPPAYPLIDLPSRFDWTDSGGVSAVNYQQCGDCWAQCAVASMESKLLIFDGINRKLSVQQAIDCNYGYSSCSGGWWEDVYDMYMAFGPVKEFCYRYIGADGECAEDTCPVVTTIDGYSYINTSVTSIKTNLMSNGPIAVGMVVYDDFSWYGGGCYEHEPGGTINHGVLIVGWDDSMCGGAGAWHIKNSWGTYWGESGFAWIKYGTCQIGSGAVIVDYFGRSPVSLLYETHIIDDSSGDGDGNPDPGETVTVPVTIRNKHQVTATNVSATITTTAPGVTVVTGSASFADIAMGATVQSDPPHFSVAVDPSAECGLRVNFLLSITCDQDVFTDRFDMLLGDQQLVFFDDVEADSGWSLAAPDDDATNGQWRKRDPIGTFDDGILVQPEIDHTPGGAVRCFITTNRDREYPPDYGDVDDGKTTLTTPLFDLSEYATSGIRYWRWYTNDTGSAVDDVFTVDATDDSGDTWVNLETVSTSEREWVPIDFSLGDYISLTDKVMIRFVASDYGSGSVVEAGIDNFELTACEDVYASVEDLFAAEVPGQIELYGSERNPFVGATHIFFGVPQRMNVRIGVYDVHGRLTRELMNAPVGQGYHSTVWDGSSGSGRLVSPGMYFIRLEAGGANKTTKLILTR